MIISHDRKTLFIGIPKNGSQTARAVLGPLGVDLVGEMGRHPTVPEAIRLAEARFPGEAIAPTAIYAFWRDPVERFCSAVEFHKRYLPNSFIELFPERLAGTEPHPRWFETDLLAPKAALRAAIDAIQPVDILEALPPPPVSVAPYCPRGGNLSFYHYQVHWLGHPQVTTLPFSDYANSIQELVNEMGGTHSCAPLPRHNQSRAPLPKLLPEECVRVSRYYQSDLDFSAAR